jgi:hypothetical protein
MLHFAIQCRELIIERSNDANSRVVLAIEIGDLFADVVNFRLEAAHAALQLFAFAANARQLSLLSAKLRVTLILRLRLRRGEEAYGEHKSQEPQMRRR